MKKVAIITLGCPKNTIDSEFILNKLESHNYEITDNINEANIIVINTCAFIEDAKKESIDVIWEMTKYKNYGKCEILIIAGCLAERYGKELMEEIEEVDGILGTGDIEKVLDLIENIRNGQRSIFRGNIDKNYIEFKRTTNSNSVTSYIKISEGCDKYCSYCIIPKLRGKYRSREISSIVNEANRLVDGGTREIILIAQDTSRYGIDLYGEYKLPELLYELNKIQKLEWIRILYLYPDNLDSEIIRSIKENDKVVKYVDIPLQHISNKILKKMNRDTNKEDIIRLINTLRKEIPNIVIRTTLMVGFPGETDEDFIDLYKFVESMKLDKVGVFSYSREEDTPAYYFENQVNEETKTYRRNKIMELQQGISYSINKHKIGETYKTLVEEYFDKNVYIGRTYMDSPDIDGIVYINSNEELKLGEFKNVKITDCLEYDLIGEIDYEFS